MKASAGRLRSDPIGRILTVCNDGADELRTGMFRSSCRILGGDVVVLLMSEVHL